MVNSLFFLILFIATSIATTEISNHPDHAGADEELKTLEGNNTSKRSLKKISSTATGDDVFVRPATPPPKEALNDTTDKTNDTENNDNITEEVEEDGDSSEFEKIEPEN